jgi:AcrR family transcriptional regulator
MPKQIGGAGPVDGPRSRGRSFERSFEPESLVVDAPPSGTRERLLDAAERLFAARGFRGVSLRELTAEAGVNLAAVSYHFGSKQELLHAVLERRVAPVNGERLRRLAELEARAHGKPLSIDAVVTAFLAPVFEAARRQPQFQDVAALLHSEPAESVRPLLEPLFGACARRFLAALAPACDGADDTTVALRFQLVIGAMVHFLARRHLEGPALGRTSRRPADAEVWGELIRFCSAGIRAPVARAQPVARAARGGGTRRAREASRS